MTANDSPTFADLCELEPRLIALEGMARAAASRERRRWRYCCANRCWYTNIKPRMVLLVGHLRPDRHPVLGTSEAYDVAYTKLFEYMPPCRVCSCM